MLRSVSAISSRYNIYRSHHVPVTNSMYNQRLPTAEERELEKDLANWVCQDSCLSLIISFFSLTMSIIQREIVKTIELGNAFNNLHCSCSDHIQLSVGGEFTRRRTTRSELSFSALGKERAGRLLSSCALFCLLRPSSPVAARSSPCFDHLIPGLLFLLETSLISEFLSRV